MEEVATSVAVALQSDKLIFLTEIPGIRVDANDPESDIDTELPLADAKRLIASLPAATVPTDPGFYLQHCVRACEGGVERSHIIPFKLDGSLLLEIYVHDGIGTMVVDEKLESVREATIDDVSGIVALIEPFEKDGTLVKRDRTEIERDAGNYTIIEHDGVIFGCAALYPYPEERTAEMAALTVSPQSQSQGDGERLLKRIETRARAQGLHHALVHQAGLRAGQPRLVARGAQAQVQLGPPQPGAGQEAGLSASGRRRLIKIKRRQNHRFILVFCVQTMNRP
jgi:amino-acid N-acetyltransferase